MHSRLLNLLRRIGLAFVAIAVATLITLLLWSVHFTALRSVIPILYLGAILTSSWLGGYASGIASALFAFCVNVILGREFDLAEIYPVRAVLVLLLSLSVSWMEARRRKVETRLREGVEHKTWELQAAVSNLEHELKERKAAEGEVRRLNRLLERRVDERTRQLEISNHELESFSYSVSHDLRAPLRSIDGFSRILLESCSGKLDDQEKALFQRVLAATGRMNELIDDLLNLSRVTRTSMTAETVDLSETAQRIVSDLQRDHPESSTEFIIEPGLSAACDSRLIEVALHNLLENAWKFSAQSPNPCVEFGSTSISGEPVLFVRDNGAGFDPAYKTKLFVPFQRLHRQDEFPGTGIGLATVMRIIQRHGGWIRAESQIGKGATFFFTLASPSLGVKAVVAGSYLPDEPNPPVPRPEFPSSSSDQSTIT